MMDFVNIPDYILKKYNEGKIPKAQFSDIVRTCLLVEHGGIWMDSTVLATDTLPENLLSKPLFVFRHLWRGDDSICLSNWFISSCKDNPHLKMERDLLFAYWQKYDFLCDYFLYHLFFTMIYEKYPQYINEMPLYSNVPPHIMQIELFNQYSEERYEEILRMSPVHKLTHKFSEESVRKNDTLYKHILEEYSR